MTITKYRKPRASFFPELLNEFFNDDFWVQDRPGMDKKMPAANVKETEKGVVIELSTPGFNKDDIKLELNDDVLRIYSEDKHEDEVKEDNYTRREFTYSSFERNFRIPENVDAEKIDANYEDGILKIHMPKVKKEEKKKLISIK